MIHLHRQEVCALLIQQAFVIESLSWKISLLKLMKRPIPFKHFLEDSSSSTQLYGMWLLNMAVMQSQMLKVDNFWNFTELERKFKPNGATPKYAKLVLCIAQSSLCHLSMTASTC